MNSLRVSCCWLLLGIYASLLAWQSSYAAEPSDEAEPKAASKWEGEYPGLPIEKVSREEFDAVWQMDLQVKDQPLGEVLQQILADKKDQWKVKLWPHPNLNSKITLDLKGVSHLEAIEWACRWAGVYPVYNRFRPYDDDDEPFLKDHLKRLLETPRDQPEGYSAMIVTAHREKLDMIIDLEVGVYPPIEGLEELDSPVRSVTFAGPVRVQLDQLHEDASSAAAHLELTFDSLPVLHNIEQTFKGFSSPIPWELGEVRSPQGTNLISGASIYSVTSETPLHGTSRQIELKGLTSDVDRIAKMSGEFRFKLPQAWDVIWIENPQVGDVIEEGPYRVSIEVVTANRVGFRYRIVDIRSLVPGKPRGNVMAYAFDAEGHLLNLKNTVAIMGDFVEASGYVTVTQMPALIAVVPTTEVTLADYTYTFANVPLTKYKQQIKKLEPLSFKGHSEPIEVEPLGISKVDKMKVKLRITNHSNKDVRELEIEVGPVDEQGALVNRLISTMYSSGHVNTWDGPTKFVPVIAAGDSMTEERTISTAIPRQAKLGAEIRKIIFSDGTTWSRD